MYVLIVVSEILNGRAINSIQKLNCFFPLTYGARILIVSLIVYLISPVLKVGCSLAVFINRFALFNAPAWLVGFSCFSIGSILIDFLFFGIYLE